MSADWSEISIEELKDSSRNAIAMGPFGSNIKAENFVKEGIPVIKGGNLTGDFIVEDKFDFLTEEKADQLKASNAFRRDIVITHRGTIGQVGIIPDNSKFERYVVSQSQLKVTLDQEKVNPYFVYYFLRSPVGQNRLLMNASQVGVPAIAQASTSVKAIMVPFPEKIIQDKVVDIILCIDHKIHKNRQINQTLESMAQAIFKSWFVDFEPVKAKIAALESGEDAEGVTRAAMRAISGKTDDELDKMEGGQPENYARLKTTAGLFPAAMQDSELGEVPEGWGIKQLDHIAHYQNGLPLQNFRPENGEDYLPVLKIAQLNKGFADGNEKASVNIKPECIVDNGDVVFSWSGSLMVDIWCGGKIALNQHLFKVTSEKYPKWFYYYWTKHHLSEFQRIASAKAVTMGHIKREHLSSAMCAAPGLQIFENASKAIECLVEKSIEVRLENFMLQNLRDTLLPKLLSGELSVDALKITNEQGEASNE